MFWFIGTAYLLKGVYKIGKIENIIGHRFAYNLKMVMIRNFP